MKQGGELGCLWINRSDIAPFVPIAKKAGPTQIIDRGFTTMFDCDNVIWLVREQNIIFVNQTIFTPSTGSMTDLFPERTRY